LPVLSLNYVFLYLDIPRCVWENGRLPSTGIYLNKEDINLYSFDYKFQKFNLKILKGVGEECDGCSY
jgi:hypothetical protein